jgi:ion channel POLLUX/CASTOR
VTPTRTRDRARYAFDNVMARGTPALVGLLALASAALVLIVSVAAWLVTPADVRDNGSLPGVLWRSLLGAMDPGTIGGESGSRLYLFLMFLVTIGGIFIFSALISVLTAGLDAKITYLQRGRSRIIESDHTVLLGWSDQVFVVLSELVQANESRRKPCVAILADLDRIEMEEMIRERLGTTANTRVVCRRGNPLKAADVSLVSPDTARSIVVITPPVPDPDTHVIKILLSLGARRWESEAPPVVAAVSKSHNLAAALLAGGPAAQVIDAADIGIRLLVQSHRQRGLCTVCTDLLDFDGNEFYLRAEPSLVGRTYGEALDAYELGSPIGVRSTAGLVRINPPVDTVVAAGDELIVLAEDDVLIRLATSPTPVVEDAITATAPVLPPPIQTLVLGWNQRAATIVRLLDSFCEPGSRLVVATEWDDPTPALEPLLVNTDISYQRCDLNDRPQLEKLDVGSFQHLMVLSDDSVDEQEADARTLVTLLHLRDMENRLGESYAIVTEMNDDANREVAEVTQADDFVVSTKLISLLLTQLSEDRRLGEVFAALFSPEGSEIHLKPAGAYLRPGATANFATVLEAARRRGETAIGYRLAADVGRSPAYGVTLNPDRQRPLTLTEADQVVVLAES